MVELVSLLLLTSTFLISTFAMAMGMINNDLPIDADVPKTKPKTNPSKNTRSTSDNRHPDIWAEGCSFPGRMYSFSLSLSLSLLCKF